MNEQRYKRWDDPDAVDRFAAKKADDFFATETRFLDSRAMEFTRVLDIGCASGRFIELLASLGAHPAYTGVDISPEQIASARKLYPTATFHLGDAVDLDLKGPFDLVNATGVMQHEPAFERLIARMLELSSRDVMFDVKLSMLDDHISDLTRAHAGTPEHPLYFNVLSTRRFVAFLETLPGVSDVAVFGYETRPNASTTVPPELTRLVSAGVLLQRGEGPASVSVDLPEGFWP